MTFIEDPQFEAKLKAEQSMRQFLLAKAKRVAKLAGTLAAHDTGHYARSVKTDWDQSKKVARVYTDDIAGHLIEFGGPKNTAQAPLRRAADVECDGFTAVRKP